MSSSRKIKACWTCRLRKKKCDGTRPQCSPCNSLSIPCHGYGPKPEWMNYDETQREVAESLKQVVKQTSRRRATAPINNGSKGVVRLAPKSLEESSGDSASSPSLGFPSNTMPSIESEIWLEGVREIPKIRNVIAPISCNTESG